MRKQQRGIRYNAISFLTVLFLFFLSSKHLFAQTLTSSDVLAKVQANFDSIQDLQLTITYTINNDGKSQFTRTIKHWMKRPNKVKVMDLATESVTISTEASNPSSDKRSLPIWPFPAMIFTSTGTLGNWDASIDDTHDATDKTCKLRFVPKGADNFSPPMEWFVDSENWTVTQINIYGTNGILIRKVEIPEYELVNESIWFPKIVADSLIAQKTVTRTNYAYSDVKISAGLDDSVFTPEP